MKKIFDWIKTHKKEFFIFCAAVGGFGAAYILLKDSDIAEEVSRLIHHKAEHPISNHSPAEECINRISTLSEAETLNTMPRSISYANTEPFPVSGHIRTLTEGRKASLAKRLEAEELGIQLMDGQTYVSEFTKCRK